MRVSPRQLMNLAKRTERLSSQAFRARQMELVPHLDKLAIELASLSSPFRDKDGRITTRQSKDMSGRRERQP